jgi:ABC-type multidrug transport system ATPase subunit
MLNLENVSHVYSNGTRALDHVTLSIPRGMYGLLGPNGAGKSTLMRTIATLQTPTEGKIRFGDIDVIAEPERLRRTLGYLPQDFGVYPRVSAYAMLDQMAVLKGITGKGERKAVVETLLNQTNLWAVRDKAIAGFSGGMRQRFGIAQALIGNPELIIVDEPTAGLDPRTRVEEGDRPFEAGGISAEPRDHLDPALRRPDHHPHPLRQAARRLRAGRRRA